jgi:IS605 OrfB family transposase
MQLVAPIKLLPTAQHADVLARTLERANAARSWIAARGAERGMRGRTVLHRLTYAEARERFGTSAQMTVRAIGSVVECFARDKHKTPRFRPQAAFPYDGRILRIGVESVSIWTLEGRQTIPFVCGPRQRALLNQAQRTGECDLRPLPDGRWMLYVSVTVDTPALIEPNGWLGVDLGVVNIATDTDGQVVAGGHLNGLRRRHRRLRGKLQKRGTRAAKRRLRKRAGRERRFATHVNHCIAKELVCRAERTGRGIALEDLSGIRGRIRARRSQRGVLHSWAFRQLRDLIAYKAQLQGVPVVYVDPRNSSRECPRCGHIEKRNRPDRDRFCCVGCNLTGHADYIAALNRGSRAAVSRPDLTGVRAISHDAQSKTVCFS